MSRGEVWNAQESSLSLQANEDLASSSQGVRNSQVKLGGKVSGNSLNLFGRAVLMLEFELTGYAKTSDQGR